MFHDNAKRYSLSTRLCCCALIGATLLTLFLPPGSSEAAKCFLTITTMNFGPYDMLSPTPADTTSQLNIRCNNQPRDPLTVTLSLSPGNGSYAQRTMVGAAGGTLLYNIFANSGMSSIMGDGTGESVNRTRILDKNTPWNVTLYGRIPDSQTVPLGLYSDSLTVSVVW